MPLFSKTKKHSLVIPTNILGNYILICLGWPFLMVPLPQKAKHRITVQPSNSTHRYTPKRNDKTYTHRNLYTNVFNITHQKMLRHPKCPSLDEE